MTKSDLSRRSFIKLVGVGAAGLVLSIDLEARTSTKPFQPNVYLQIDANGTTTVTITRSDMGQGVRTSLAMIIADELGADWSKVKVVQADGNRELYGSQSTGGSSSTRSLWRPLREAGATARMMFIAAAAKQWNVSPSECVAEAGVVRCSKNGMSAKFAELLPLINENEMPKNGDVTLKSKAERTIIGKPTSRIDNKVIVVGEAKFCMDVKIPGARTAVVARSPFFGAKIESIDDSASLKVPGVRKVVQLYSGAAVVADDTYSAMKGRDALKVKWSDPPATNSASLLAEMKAKIVPFDSYEGATKKITTTYEFPFLAHATMETMNCAAAFRGETCEIWAPTQSPDEMQRQIARAVGIEESKVTVHVTLIGGGFGRRLNQDFGIEAAVLSKEIGEPVRVLWTRADDMRHDHYRPATYHACEAGLNDQGEIIFWQHQLISSAGGARRSRPETCYRLQNDAVNQSSIDAAIPTGAWRSVSHTHLGFVNECLIDELAHLAGKDPIEFRLAHMKQDRTKKVLEKARDLANWGKSLPKGRARGVGCFEGYGASIAQIVELSVLSGGKVKLHRVTAVVDVGLCINPLGARAQIEGATVDGLSTALKAAITIKDGGVVQSSFGDYEWMRIDEVPPIDVTILETSDQPSGLGEVGYPAVGPAVANAIFAATGKRVHRLPIRSGDLK